jgi:hypothetical protein
MEKLESYLKENPIVCPSDISFLRMKVLEHPHTVEQTNNANQSNNVLLEKEWRGKTPMLCLIHCIIEDDSTGQAFLSCYDIDSDRLAVENRNSVEKRPETVWEIVSNHWNNSVFNP